jgi:hypothetical protein
MQFGLGAVLHYSARLDSSTRTRTRTKAPLQPQQPAPGGVGDGFRTASDVHLGEDRFPVRLDGAFANEEG